MTPPRWLALGLNDVKYKFDGLRLVEAADHSPVVEIVHHASGRGNWQDFEHVHRYQLLPSGELSVENVVNLGSGVTDIPRVGVTLALVPGMEQLAWFGRGPWDSAWLGLSAAAGAQVLPPLPRDCLDVSRAAQARREESRVQSRVPHAQQRAFVR